MTHSQPTPQSDTLADATAAALGRIPSGLFVVTWRAHGSDGTQTDRAMLASWVMQGGFAPPCITIAVAKSRDLLGAIDRGAPFVINILADSQRPLLARFGRPAGPDENPFAGLPLERTGTGAAALADAAAWLECRAVTQAVEPEHDHAIILALVISAGAGAAAEPLVHLRKNGLRY
jgi:flavin reductase (DIM6/NTAB) family NADH-FMN oxidoreductase RutF